EALDLQSVDCSALGEVVEATQFHVVRGDEQLAALVERNSVRGGELLGGLCAPATQLGLAAAGLVVDPGMDDAAVVASLVRAQLRRLLHQQQAGTGAPLEQLQGGRGADDPSADHAEVVHRITSPGRAGRATTECALVRRSPRSSRSDCRATGCRASCAA